MKKRLKKRKIIKSISAGLMVGIVTAPLAACDIWTKDVTTKPTNPTQPTKPTNPTQPTKPTNPTQPTKPTNPNKPKPKPKPKPTPNVVVQKPSYASLGITGISGTAKMTTPPTSTIDYTVKINLTNNIRNKDVIKIEYTNAKMGGTVNGKQVEVFTYTVTGLSEPQVKHDLTINKPVLNYTGNNGHGSFVMPSFPNTTVTTSATNNGSLSNGDTFTITVRGNSTPTDIFTINGGQGQVVFHFTVSGLNIPIIDLNIAKPTLAFSGMDGSGSFTMPSFPHTTITTSATNNGSLSNGDTFTITVTADKGYTVNGQKSVQFSFTVSQLTANKPAPNVTIKPGTQGYDLNNINVQEVVEKTGQKTIIGYFGSDWRKSPIIFSSSEETFNMGNFPAGRAPYIKKSEMIPFIKMWFKYITRGVDLPSVGLIALDNSSLSQSGADGWLVEHGLGLASIPGNKYKIKYMPDNRSKTLITVNAKSKANYVSTYSHKLDYNDLDAKFEAIYEILQHEYGHNLSNYNTIQAPTYIDRDKNTAQFEIAGTNNGYFGNLKNGFSGLTTQYYLAKKYLKQLATSMGVDVNKVQNQTFALTQLLKERESVINSGGSLKDVEEKLSLWFFRLMVGTSTALGNGDQSGSSIGWMLDRNKIELWPGKVVGQEFRIRYNYWYFAGSQIKNVNFQQFDGYATGYHEAMTRMLVLATTKKEWWFDYQTFVSVISGQNPFYTYKKGLFNFSDKTDSKYISNKMLKDEDWDSNFKPVPKKYPESTLQLSSKIGDGNGDHLKYAKVNGQNLSRKSSTASKPAVILNNGIKDRIDTAKRDRIINFYKDDVLGYGKTISLYSKMNRNNGYKDSNGNLSSTYQSLNLVGGWTKKKHQYLLWSNYATPQMMVQGAGVAYPINSANTLLSFRGAGNETYKNRSINFNQYKGWYVDFSSSLVQTHSDSQLLNHRILSFWDDNNNDGVVQANEVTQIPWTDAKVTYDHAEKIYSSGAYGQHKRYTFPQTGELLTSSGFEVNGNYYVLSKSYDGWVAFENDN